MDGQLLIVIGIIAVAAAYLVRAVWRSVTAKGCGSGCGKCAQPKEEPVPGRIRLL